MMLWVKIFTEGNCDTRWGGRAVRVWSLEKWGRVIMMEKCFRVVHSRISLKPRQEREKIIELLPIAMPYLSLS